MCPSSPADKEPAASKESVPQVVDTGLVLPTITSRSPNINAREGAKPGRELERIKLPKTGKAREIKDANTDVDSPQHKQARSKRGDITGPKAGVNTLKSRTIGAHAAQTELYRADRRRTWHNGAKNAQSSSPQRLKLDKIGPNTATRHLISRGGHEGAALERNVIKLPKSGAHVGGVADLTSKDRAKFPIDIASSKHAKGSQPRVMGPMSPRIAARNAAQRLSIRTNFEESSAAAQTRTWRISVKKLLTPRRRNRLSQLQTTYMNPHSLGKHYFSESMSPMNKTQSRKTQVKGVDSPVDVAEKARVIFRKGLDASS